MTLEPTKLVSILDEIDREFIFASVSGAHLYGFESFNSDLDIRATHWPTLGEFQRYSTHKDTLEVMLPGHAVFAGEIDIVSHSILKYLNLLTRSPNGYVLEQILSSLVLTTSPAHEELKVIARQCFCKELRLHYGGFYRNQQILLSKQKKEIKLILYQARILNTAYLLAQSGTIEVNLLETNAQTKLFDQVKLTELVELKRAGEKNNFPEESLKDYWVQEINKKEAGLVDVFDCSGLPSFDQKTISKLCGDFVLRHFEFGIRP